MMQNILATMLFGGTLLVAGCSAEQTATPEAAMPSASNMQSTDITYVSRGVEVPATIVTPVSDGNEPVPLVVMAHGHGGSRQEGGGYEQVAAAMAERGIATIRMDFPGCGDSTESFTENNLSNMLLDLQAAREFVATQINVDTERTGLLGYSMGGRLVALLSEIDPNYKAMVMWAPAAADGAGPEIVSRFGGEQGFADMHEEAAAQGSIVYTTMWGADLELGPGWFSDLAASRPQAAIAKFTGPLLVIYGDADQSVPPAVAATAVTAAINSSEARELVIPSARHGLGFYTERPEIASQVVEATADFPGRLPVRLTCFVAHNVATDLTQPTVGRVFVVTFVPKHEVVDGAHFDGRFGDAQRETLHQFGASAPLQRDDQVGIEQSIRNLHEVGHDQADGALLSQ